MTWLLVDGALLALLTLAVAGWVELEEWLGFLRQLRRPPAPR